MNPVSVVIPAVLAVLLCWYVIIWFRAESPKAHTLEWVSMYRCRHFEITGFRYRYDWMDAVWACVPAVVAACVAFLVSWRSQGGYFGTLAALLPAILSAVTSALIYLLLRSFSGKVPAALLGAGLFALCPFSQAGLALPVIGAMYFLWLWATGDGYGVSVWLYLAAALAFAEAGLLLAPGFVVLLVPVLICFAVILLHRIRKEDYSLLRAGLLLLYLLAVAAVFFLAVCVFYGAQNGMIFPESFADGDYFTFVGAVLSQCVGEFSALQPGLTAEFLAGIFVEPVDALLMLAGFPVLIIACVRRRHIKALYLLGWNCAALLLLFLYGGDLLVLSAALVSGYLAARLIKRGRPVAAIIGGGGPILLNLAMTVAIMILGG